MYIYRAVKKYIPPMEEIKEFPTEEETIRYLQNNGGGVYRNILHNFECWIPDKNNPTQPIPAGLLWWN